jgi:phenylacetate-CoA ligase
MVRHAAATVPHYREALAAAGLRPEDVRGADDLARLPLVGGDDLAAAPERFASNRHPADRTLALSSSGTGGRPKTVRYQPAALFTALAHGQRQRAVLAHFVGRRFGYREMSVQRRDSVAEQLRAFYEAQAWVPRAVDLRRTVLPVDTGFDEAVARIDEFRPEVIFGYGSFLGALFRRAAERGHALHRPRVLWYGADAMADADRALIEGELGIPVVSTYQADEALRLGFQCELRGGFHLVLDDVAVRVVDGDGRTLPAGERGEIVVSNLTNRATVLLNYKLGDLVTLDVDPCPCGRTLPTLARIEGRADDLVALPDGDVRHPIALLHALQSVPGVVGVQVVQEEVARFTLRAVCAAGTDWPPTARRLRETLAATLGHPLSVDAVRVEELPREAGGKVRAVISRCGGPA